VNLVVESLKTQALQPGQEEPRAVGRAAAPERRSAVRGHSMGKGAVIAVPNREMPSSGRWRLESEPARLL
jgi:hypothetical protein